MESIAPKKQTRPVLFFLAIVVAAAAGFNLYTGGKFLTSSNIAVLLSHAVIPSFVAWGLAFVFACDFTDMSLGAVIILAANAAGNCGSTFGYPGVVLGGVSVGILLITLNFFIYTTTRIPSWVAGIGMAMLYEAAGVFYSNSRAVAGGTSSRMYKAILGAFVVIIIENGLVLLGYSSSQVSELVGGSGHVDVVSINITSFRLSFFCLNSRPEGSCFIHFYTKLFAVSMIAKCPLIIYIKNELIYN